LGKIDPRAHGEPLGRCYVGYDGGYTSSRVLANEGLDVEPCDGVHAYVEPPTPLRRETGEVLDEDFLSPSGRKGGGHGHDVRVGFDRDVGSEDEGLDACF